MTKFKPGLIIIILGYCSAAAPARAGKLLDYIRNYDLNDYALGVSVAVSESPYNDVDPGSYMYPYLTSFEYMAFTDDWLIATGGDVGARYVKGDWELGVVGRVKTLGLTNGDTSQIRTLSDRDMGLELAPLLGYRKWPIHLQLKAYNDILNNYGGYTSELHFSYPTEWQWGYLVPGLQVNYLSDKYANYFYGETPDARAASGELYRPDDSINLAASMRYGYQLSSKWLLSGTLKYEFLDEKIQDSPLVEQEGLWSFNLGLAYNADAFQPRNSDGTYNKGVYPEIRMTIFGDNITSKYEQSGSQPGIPIEDVLGMSDYQTVYQFEGTLRLGYYHQLSYLYLNMDRRGSRILGEEIVLENQLFAAGNEIQSDFNNSVSRLAYGYSLMRDSQKELTFMAGIHLSRFKLSIRNLDTGNEFVASQSAPLPTIGVKGSVAIRNNIQVGATAEIFRLDFDQYEGNMNFISLDASYRFNPTLQMGVGWSRYTNHLTANEPGYIETYKVRHTGPYMFINMSI